MREYRLEDFDKENLTECDLILKGGVASGIVYPYAILELATKHRFANLGGSSVGAIATALAAAAEYARSTRKDPKGFLRFKERCDELPKIMPSLFQVKPKLETAKAIALAFLGKTNKLDLWLKNLIIPAILSLAVLTFSLFYFSTFHLPMASIWIIAILNSLAMLSLSSLISIWLNIGSPIFDTIKQMPDEQFGFCSGISVNNGANPAITDWLHDTIQYVAFGEGYDAKPPLTFGDLEENANGKKIELRMVATNLSLARPHRLPFFKLGAIAFDLKIWRKLFPKPIIDFLLNQAGNMVWPRDTKTKCYPLPEGAQMPILIAARMSMSFPLLFCAIPIVFKDKELTNIDNNLCKADENQSLFENKDKGFRTLWISDGGISSNFPVHLFDEYLPSRPTYAINLTSLSLKSENNGSHVYFPQETNFGIGVPAIKIENLFLFAKQILNSAKDWQDQLLSEITGQRERIIKVYLDSNEGGYNIAMTAKTSAKLMAYGLEAGQKFNNGTFDFNEHRWNRLLVFYKNLAILNEKVSSQWNAHTKDWYVQYKDHAIGFPKISAKDRESIALNMAQFCALSAQFAANPIDNLDSKFPQKTGKLTIGPYY